MGSANSLESLFVPGSVAVVGASHEANKSGTKFLQKLVSQHFPGKIYPVNPAETEVLGLKAYHSIRDIPADVDLAIMAIPAEATPPVMADCAAKKVKFAIMYTAGFREIGDSGRSLEAEVLRIARSGGVRVVGPNCLGICCPGSVINTIVPNLDRPLDPGNIGFIGQSGWASESVIATGADRGLSFSKVVSIGNQADLTLNDYLEYLSGDPETKVIGAYIEGIGDGRRFFELARRAVRKKPLVFWKAGRTAAGARAALSHTASLAGRDLITDAAFRQVGVIRASNVDEVMDFTAAFSAPFLPRGNRLGVVEESGGSGIACCDACEGSGLEVPEFSPEIQADLRLRINGLARPFTSLRNPIDLISPRRFDYYDGLFRLFEGVAQHVDAILYFTYNSLSDKELASSLATARDRLKKPIYLVPPYPSQETEAIRTYTRIGIPAFTTPDRAARAIAAASRYVRFIEEG